MKTSREQFDEWYAEHWGCTEDNIESMFDKSPYSDEYYRFGVRLAFDAWQASRAAIEVKLPDTDRHDAVWLYEIAVKNALDACDVKYKGA